MHINQLKKVSTASVHFIRSEEFKTNLDSLGFTIFEGSVGDIKTEQELFSVVASAMRFPDYFGNNWDALDECLSDMSWLYAEGYLLILHDAAKGWSQSPYVLGRFVTTWLEASEYWAEEQTPFHLIFVI